MCWGDDENTEDEASLKPSRGPPDPGVGPEPALVFRARAGDEKKSVAPGGAEGAEGAGGGTLGETTGTPVVRDVGGGGGCVIEDKVPSEGEDEADEAAEDDGVTFTDRSKEAGDGGGTGLDDPPTLTNPTQERKQGRFESNLSKINGSSQHQQGDGSNPTGKSNAK